MTGAPQAPQAPVLYHYWRSSSSWRVRWALLLKRVEHEVVPVNLLEGQQGSDAHRLRNPFATVPVLQVGVPADRPDASPSGRDEGSLFLGESVAIIEYLEEAYPGPALLPADPLARARVRQLVELINAGTQPLQNLSVLRRVSAEPAEQRAWAQHFIGRGLDAYEALLAADGGAGPYSVGAQLTMADLFLVPQCYNARRQGLDVAAWPRIAAVEAACLATQEAQDSAPDQQPH